MSDSSSDTSPPGVVAVEAVLQNPATLAARQAQWQAEAKHNDGTHPLVRPAATRLLRRMRARALPPLQGAGLSEAGDRTGPE